MNCHQGSLSKKLKDNVHLFCLFDAKVYTQQSKDYLQNK